jgi:6-phosphogluconate dehydrogenase (decarboxylating)
LLKSAKDLAEKATNDAQVNKAKAKADAEATIAALPSMLEEARKTLAKAPRGKDTKADIEAMQNDLKLAEEALNGANQAMAQEKYNDALAQANSAKEKAASVIDQVQRAREKVTGKR